MSSQYAPITKKTKKFTGKILGSVTESQGFIESDKRKIQKLATKSSGISNLYKTISVKEYWMISFINQYGLKIKLQLKTFFPDCFKEIIYLHLLVLSMLVL